MPTKAKLEAIRKRATIVTEIIAGGECPYDSYYPDDVSSLLAYIEAMRPFVEAKAKESCQKPKRELVRGKLVYAPCLNFCDSCQARRLLGGVRDVL